MFNELPFVFKFGSYQKAQKVFKTKNLMPFYLIAVMNDFSSLKHMKRPIFTAYHVSWYLNDVYNCSQSPLTSPRPHPRSSPHSNCSLINYFSWVKRGANRPGSQFQNLWEPVSVTEGEILPHLLIAPVTPAGSFARCMVLVLQERRDQLAQILYHDCKNLVSWGASA